MARECKHSLGGGRAVPSFPPAQDRLRQAQGELRKRHWTKPVRTELRRSMNTHEWALFLIPRLSSFSLCLVLLSSSLASALPWNDDMYWQPGLEAGTAVRPPVANSVPTTGIEPPISSRITERIKAGLRVQNPVEATEQSIQNGKELFRIYCTMCHGQQGKGDGPMVGKVMPSSNLHAERIQRQKDGYLYATIRSGGLVMPAYQHAISTKERWDIVNYVRYLQQQSQQEAEQSQ